MRHEASVRESTWGLPPYGALAAELKFGNEAAFKRGSLAQELKPLWLQRFLRRFSDRGNRPIARQI